MADGNAPKRVLLHKILYRIDFQLIAEKCKEKLFEYVSNEFGASFTNTQQEMLLPNTDEASADPSCQSLIRQKAQPVIVFKHPQTPDCDGRTLKIGRTFLFLELLLNLNTMQIPYYEWIGKIVSNLQENPMFRLSRVGLRKFNSFYMLDRYIHSLKDLLSIAFLSDINNDDYKLDNTESTQIYSREKYALRFHKTCSSGILSNPSEKQKMNVRISLTSILTLQQQI